MIGKKFTPGETIDAILAEMNRVSEEIAVTIPGAGEVGVIHGLDYIPTSFQQVTTQATTGQGILFNGTTAWTNTLLYVMASSTGVYHLRVRR